MSGRGLLLFLGLLAAATFLPPVAAPAPLTLRLIDPDGRDAPCARDFARLEGPDRRRATPLSPFHDFAYAAAEAGPEGCLWVLGGLGVLVLVVGLWSRGVRTGLRRLVLTWALGVPLCLALLYSSSFLEGRTIRLGPQAERFAAASLHAQTDHTTGLLSPRDVVRWHWARGFAVLNVSDRDSVAAGREAAAYARGERFEPRILVTAGEEWHGGPDVVLVHVTKTWWTRPRLSLDELARAVHGDGGALFVAHPWSKIPEGVSLEEVLADVDGMEIVNGVIHGGRSRLDAALGRKRALLGVLDYKYGPHVTALTLLDASAARTPEGVVRALRQGRTLVLYAIPGGPVSGEEWSAGQLGLTGARAGLRTLQECPRSRRAVSFVWIAGAAVLWWLTTRDRGKQKPPPPVRFGRVLFTTCAALELAVPAGVSWQARALVGTIPVPYLLGAALLLAVPLLLSSQILARAEP